MPIYVYKTADETRGNIGEPVPISPVLIDDADLQLVLPVGLHDLSMCCHFYQGTNSNFAAGVYWQLRFTGTIEPNLTTLTHYVRRANNAGTDGLISGRQNYGYLSGTNLTVYGSNTQVIFQSGGTSSRGVILMRGIIAVTVEGTLKLAWMKKSNTAGSGNDQTLKEGSYIFTRELC